MQPFIWKPSSIIEQIRAVNGTAYQLVEFHRLTLDGYSNDLVKLEGFIEDITCYRDEVSETFTGSDDGTKKLKTSTSYFNVKFGFIHRPTVQSPISF